MSADWFITLTDKHSYHIVCLQIKIVIIQSGNQIPLFL